MFIKKHSFNIYLFFFKKIKKILIKKDDCLKFFRIIIENYYFLFLILNHQGIFFDESIFSHQ
jgi:hypothetical protein